MSLLLVIHANKMSGFVLRTSGDFNDFNTMKTLFFILVQLYTLELSPSDHFFHFKTNCHWKILCIYLTDLKMLPIAIKLPNFLLAYKSILTEILPIRAYLFTYKRFIRHFWLNLHIFFILLEEITWKPMFVRHSWYFQLFRKYTAPVSEFHRKKKNPEKFKISAKYFAKLYSGGFRESRAIHIQLYRRWRR